MKIIRVTRPAHLELQANPVAIHSNSSSVTQVENLAPVVHQVDVVSQADVVRVQVEPPVDVVPPVQTDIGGENSGQSHKAFPIKDTLSPIGSSRKNLSAIQAKIQSLSSNGKGSPSVQQGIQSLSRLNLLTLPASVAADQSLGGVTKAVGATIGDIANIQSAIPPNSTSKSVKLQSVTGNTIGGVGSFIQGVNGVQSESTTDKIRGGVKIVEGGVGVAQGLVDGALLYKEHVAVKPTSRTTVLKPVQAGSSEPVIIPRARLARGSGFLGGGATPSATLRTTVLKPAQAGSSEPVIIPRARLARGPGLLGGGATPSATLRTTVLKPVQAGSSEPVIIPRARLARGSGLLGGGATPSATLRTTVLKSVSTGPSEPVTIPRVTFNRGSGLVAKPAVPTTTITVAPVAESTISNSLKHASKLLKYGGPPLAIAVGGIDTYEGINKLASGDPDHVVEGGFQTASGFTNAAAGTAGVGALVGVPGAATAATVTAPIAVAVGVAYAGYLHYQWGNTEQGEHDLNIYNNRTSFNALRFRG
ncbi:hypothetical protein BLA6863_04723 [Burkholderia lata]|uniref:Uncharacterized protein n=1 Tax=Burkholderia lata (strain ATCC 17760 / DSM 23089 / LMG 22485 / NCIMB 9086 / R18194 / 383) TaxID=482957 RepID=A0A6P2NTP7_BURL3|nr:hypothetical protein BLA6863_04723 [Burkholderia lata]